ncbi:glycosyltransferase family 4 protein [Sulfuriroseicoccus oceanibius]|uniref:Uncharacterized protein n=1 Tax=Sulfuriroseicoccus oceanibius TaxID=2707525 RepID=A0A6B3L3Q5_9BACT|nr:glycosyltransferase family 4 protein [Sulfuriroseicoccus oceanibius]QQL44657.1 hypothetical protein G3M56_012320 [Sulfuriroseicoccus oceanibius]
MTTQTHVICPNGKDPYQEFVTRKELNEPTLHAPINFHAYAAATKGCFATHIGDLTGKQGIFIVLLRGRLVSALRTIKKLKKEGATVWVTWKETGRHQIARSLTRFGAESRARRCLGLADAAVTPSAAAREFFAPLCEKLGKPMISLPTPYPMDVIAWRSNLPLDQRNGIFIGTREFNVPSRNHTKALQIAAKAASRNQCRLSVINPDGPKGAERIRATVAGLPDEHLHIIEGKRPYRDYLRLIAAHRLVFQLDTSEVPGQVAGDCLLTKTMCIGGNGEVETIAFPETCIDGMNVGARDWDALLDIALTNDAFVNRHVAMSQQLGAAVLSFTAYRKEIDRLTSELPA